MQPFLLDVRGKHRSTWALKVPAGVVFIASRYSNNKDEITRRLSNSFRQVMQVSRCASTCWAQHPFKFPIIVGCKTLASVFDRYISISGAKDFRNCLRAKFKTRHDSAIEILRILAISRELNTRLFGQNDDRATGLCDGQYSVFYESGTFPRFGCSFRCGLFRLFGQLIEIDGFALSTQHI